YSSTRYTEQLTYPHSLRGYTEITSENFFPKNLSGNKIMLFIPDSDSEYDNVYWITGDDQSYITEMGARTRKTESTVKFENPPVNIHTIPAETLQSVKRLS